jgi:hypothetical protein
MDPNFESHKIINTNELDNYLDNYIVLNYIHFSNNKLLITYKDKNIINDLFTKKENSKNVSVSISSAISSYSRIFMSKFKNNTDFKLYYSDTDSLYIDKPLDDQFIGTELGQFKLENIFNKAVFLAPKVYGGITENGEEIIKIKGFKNPIPFEELEKLLHLGNSLKLNQEKWYKTLNDGNISIQDQLYTLNATENKRNLIYKNNILVGTTPFKIQEIESDDKDYKSDTYVEGKDKNLFILPEDAKDNFEYESEGESTDDKNI